MAMTYMRLNFEISGIPVFEFATITNLSEHIAIVFYKHAHFIFFTKAEHNMLMH